MLKSVNAMDAKRKVDGGGAADLDDADRAAKRIKVPSWGWIKTAVSRLAAGEVNPRITTSLLLVLIFAAFLFDLQNEDGHKTDNEQSDDLSQGETRETTTYYGLKFMNQLKSAPDKHGRLFANTFATLPGRHELPGYYEMTRMPIALDTIEAKLNNYDFSTLSELECYFKRFIKNNKDYHDRDAPIHRDAERVRKALVAYMTKTNPEYKRTPGLKLEPTPFPKEDDGNSQYAGVSYSSLNFQQAQEKVVADVLSYKENPEDDFFEFEPFVSLPPRSLKDYYQVIPNPHCLKDLHKRVKGIHGKASTGVSDFKTWAAFEEDASLIWKNAFHYNEDGSEIFVLAKELESFFKKTLEKAKQAVPEPVAPKIKINVKGPEPSPKITLRVGGGRGTPADSPAPQTNGAGANSAASINGEGRRNPFSSTQSSATPAPSLDQLERARSMSNSAASPTPSNSAPVKNEDAQLTAAPTQGNNRATSQAVSTPTPAPSNMPPPNTPGASNYNTYNQNGYAQSFSHLAQQNVSSSSFESKWRAPGKDASHAMITNLSLSTHPKLNLAHHFQMDLPPSATMAHQSITINLPSTHYYLLVKPTIAESLLERQYKLFVSAGMTRLHALPVIPGHGVDPRHPLFEARLFPGVNKIEIELIAALPKGVAKLPGGSEVEIEKITVFANLMRN
ncbi:bromodomain containing protein [Rutstroemia sp. NJR-2017a BVV2]|nr:bromodomain containing protein [Rutstroemia sp. NJR-2017a BVV2]